MDIEALKNNFDEQLAQAEKQISELETNLEKAREYRTKLLGGLETINLLKDGEDQPPTPPPDNESSEES